ncbi:FecR domain-containing protein [Echinicola sp. CAU 1574]|uniref:FecR domain-containing protein n=1 Tax=Echinicola arenosa TaxID=2774144 RepID=A0ABR9AL70_9BACT|nr:FecR family protein [Echinicola arenosa]MBD8489107.1 FecR domain-containing protein [Echinicola arenosa]
MDYSKYKTEDFVLDPEFRKWVKDPNKQHNLFWKAFLEQHPEKLGEVNDARKILLNTPWELAQFKEGEMENLWETIDNLTEKMETLKALEIVPINSESFLHRTAKNDSKQNTGKHQFSNIAAILILAIASSYILAFFTIDKNDKDPIIPILKTTAAPLGSKLHFMLPDGTKVILNAGSDLQYYPNFTDSIREVYLSGEGYFEVQKDTARPFIVHSGDLATTALGTSFNIAAYKEYPTEVALLSGSVKVMLENEGKNENKTILTPGKLAKYDPINNKLITSSFSPEKVTAWQNGTLVLDRANKQEAIDRLERWYGVKIQDHLKKNQQKWSYSGSFNNQSLRNVLVVMSYSLKFDFSIKKDTVHIFN